MIGVGLIFCLLAPVCVSGTFGESWYDAGGDIGILGTDIEALVAQVDESILAAYLEKFVSFGFKMTGSENASKAANWIYQEFADLGYYTFFDSWSFPKFADSNVVAVKNGTDVDSDAVFVISAHYDTIGRSPGANDDGSGVAALLAIANITASFSCNHTIRFIAVSGEEVGTYGSFWDAKHAYMAGENIVAVLNIDMIGYANESDEHLMQMFCPERSRWLVDFTCEVAERYGAYFELLPLYTGQYPSDHKSYNDFGFDGVQFVQVKPEKATWFHSPEDTLDKITYPYLVNITRLVLAVACELACQPIAVQVRITSPEEACCYLGNVPVLQLPCWNLFASRIRALTYIFGQTTVRVNISTDEEIASVYFTIDGKLRMYDEESPYEWVIGEERFKFFVLYRFHRLSVCVTTVSGQVAWDEMDLYVLYAP
jgi:hypothetical protein